MNANLYDLARDAWHIMRLRFFPHPFLYRYGLPVFIAIIIAVGLTNALNIRPLFGMSYNVIIFAVLMNVTKIILLTRISSEMLRHVKTNERLPFLGYVLASEALILPNLLAFSVPQLAVPLMFWNIWAFWAQTTGFMVQSGRPLRRVIVAYLVYWLAYIALISLFLSLFFTAGWLNQAEILQNIEQLFNTTRQP